MAPTSRVFATCVPPSACRSRPTISIVRTSRWQEIDLGADQIGDGECLLARQHGDADLAGHRQLGVDLGLDLVDQLAAHPLELEVHPARAGLHVPAGDLRPVVAPDDAAQRVECRVRPHEREAAGPIEVGDQDVTDGRRLDLRIELMDDLATRASCPADRPGPSVRGPKQQPAVRRLAATSGIEDRPLEDDQRWPGCVERDDPRLDRSGVGVAVRDVRIHLSCR
jgi:hypothetical protein